LDVELDTQKESDNSFDVLFSVDESTSYNKSSGTSPALSFQHVMGKVIVNVKKDAALSAIDLSKMTVTLVGMPTKARMSLRYGSFSGASTVADISAVALSKANTGYDRSYQAIIVPNNGTSFQSRQLVFNYIDENGAAQESTYDIQNTLTFSSGESQTFNVTLSTQGVVMGSATISDWYHNAETDIEITNL
jgi:archaellin